MEDTRGTQTKPIQTDHAWRSCHFHVHTSLQASAPAIPTLQARAYGRARRYLVAALSSAPAIDALVRRALRKPIPPSCGAVPRRCHDARRDEPLNLRPGEWVKVRSEEEILSTLDDSGRCMGLGFMPEQKAYCGREFKVLKMVKRIMLETDSELRTMKSPTVFLEGVLCDGQFHGNCDRSCYLFWKEPWLERVTKN